MGVKMKEDLGKITDRLNSRRFPDLSGTADLNLGAVDLVDAGGCGEVIVGIIVWILAAIVIIILIWFFGALLWSMILIFAAMLYWVFFRALRLVFKNSNVCRGDLAKSIRFALAYTLLYNFWIYAIILGAHYLH